ncbi:MAG: DUF2147 domain-containing protein [Xanthomonadales bacterium PRO7]|jgi:uncharacterized protein (DUF2147 family)|nr:DUF2147 domain-containing protein [Xanthomonadales bacterium PRO7]HMM57867.1 DUF2147 domain-containing protein [Rudaea sp.]
MRIAAIVLLGFAAHAFAQAPNASPAGLWQTFDDDTRAPKALVEIVERAGTLSGRIVKLFPAPDDDADPRCTQCAGARHNQRVVGMTILWNFHRDGDAWGGGEVLDPESGDIYRATLHLRDDATLVVHGYIGIPLLGRSQTWERQSH